jgi:hypothetical protein
MRRTIARFGVVVLVLLGACGDLEVQDSVELIGGSPVPALRLTRELPSIPALVDQWDSSGALRPVSDAWQRSWDDGSPEGARIRNEARVAVSAVLGPAVPDRIRTGLLRALDETIREATALLGVSLTEKDALTLPLSQAALARDEALEAESAGDPVRALERALLASDLLRATTAESIARLLIAEVEGILRRIPEFDPYREEDRVRAERLLAGAREALRAGEFALALRRAWYALGLVSPVPNPMVGVPNPVVPQESP